MSFIWVSFITIDCDWWVIVWMLHLTDLPVLVLTCDIVALVNDTPLYCRIAIREEIQKETDEFESQKAALEKEITRVRRVSLWKD